jgi:hypothetical protein
MKEIHLEGGRLKGMSNLANESVNKLSSCGGDSLPKEEIHLERGR